MNLSSDPGIPSPEFSALLWCANSLLRSKCDGPGSEEPFPRGETDWDKLLHLAQAHAMTPAVHDALFREGPPGVPERILQVLDEHRKSIACGNLGHTGELIRLLSAFQDKQLRIVAYKGPVLALNCYGNISLREFGDLDFLVDERDTEACEAVVKAQGYKLTRRYAWEDTFLKTGHAEVDIHRSLSPRTFPVALPFARLWRHAHKLHLADTEAYTFCTEHNLIALCVQICKDAWEDRLTLNKLCDVAALLSSQPINWDFLLMDASSMRVVRIIFFAIALARSLLDVEIPHFILAEIKRYTWIEKRVHETRYRVISAPAEKKRDVLGRIKLHFRLQENFIGRVSQLGLLFSKVRTIEG